MSAEVPATVTAAPDGTTAVLHLHGAVDFVSEDGFRAQAEQLLRDDVSVLLVDLGEVSFVDSSGLGLLVDLLRLCRDTDVTMRLRRVPESVRRLLDTTGLQDLIEVEQS